jgi:putative flavoprotein involved in K+ transport
MTTNTEYFDQSSDSVLDVIVIGAGQSGLAMGWNLARLGLRFLIVDAGPEIGHVWRSRWDSLTLFTAARYSGLPGLPFSGSPDSYPTKDAAAQYLCQYATTFGLPIRHKTRVTRVSRNGAAFAGLYFLGLPWQHTRGSAFLGFVGADASHIAAHIAAVPAVLKTA